MSQAHHAMRTDVLMNKHGLNGMGVNIGILSDSYDNFNPASGSPRTSAKKDIANHDLPPDVKILAEGPKGIDEGRAMMNLIYDVAPKAKQIFHTAFNGVASFASGIKKLQEAGADIIVDDVIYFAEPMYQDGVIAQAVDDVKSKGVAYFSSAGNNGRSAYESAFRKSGKKGFAGHRHDFDPSDDKVVDLQRVKIPEGSRVLGVFQWVDPFYSVSNKENGGAKTDIDVVMYNAAGQRVSFGGVNGNKGGDPVEIFEYFNDGTVDADGKKGPDSIFYLGIELFEGPPPPAMKYILFSSSGVDVLDFYTHSGTVYGHANAMGACAVGAVFYNDTPPYSSNPLKIEKFSSAGPQHIFFRSDGSRLKEFQYRAKPDVVGPDGTNTPFFIEGMDPEKDGNPNFFGTSAAAPNVAAAASLLLQAHPKLAPGQVYEAFKQSATDMNDPNTKTQDKGFDHGTGFGLVNAEKALIHIRTKILPQGPGRKQPPGKGGKGDPPKKKQEPKPVAPPPKRRPGGEQPPHHPGGPPAHKPDGPRQHQQQKKQLQAGSMEVDSTVDDAMLAST